MNAFLVVLLLAANIVIETEDCNGRKLLTYKKHKQTLIYFLLTKNAAECARHYQKPLAEDDEELKRIEQFFLEEDTDGTTITTA